MAERISVRVDPISMLLILRISKVVISGAIGMVQEQAPLQYATRHAEMGIHAVTFDHRFFGISEGSPRQFEHPEKKSEDIEALALYLKP